MLLLINYMCCLRLFRVLGVALIPDKYTWGLGGFFPPSSPTFTQLKSVFGESQVVCIQAGQYSSQANVCRRITAGKGRCLFKMQIPAPHGKFSTCGFRERLATLRQEAYPWLWEKLTARKHISPSQLLWRTILTVMVLDGFMYRVLCHTVLVCLSCYSKSLSPDGL